MFLISSELKINGSTFNLSLQVTIKGKKQVSVPFIVDLAMEISCSGWKAASLLKYAHPWIRQGNKSMDQEYVPQGL